MAPSVHALSVAPIKGTRLQRVDSIELGVDGARGDRRFFLVDERDRMVNGKTLGALSEVVCDCDDGVLRVRFPDGRVVAGEVATGARLSCRFYSRQREGRLVEGPFAAALSAHAGATLRLLESIGSIDRGRRGAVSLISRASLARLAAEGEVADVDGRRFRMTVEVDGLTAHEEDRWIGRSCQLGDATVRWHGHVGRCLITSRHPETGEIDLPTLEILGDYRRELDTTEPLAFGIYGEVLSPGRVSVGDRVELLEPG